MLKNFYFFGIFSRKSPDVNFYGNLPVKSALIHADRQRDITKVFATMRTFPIKVGKNSNKFYKVLYISSVLPWRRKYEAS